MTYHILDVRLWDGVPIDSPALEIQGHPQMKLSAKRRRDLAYASWYDRKGKQGHSLILVKNERLLAAVYEEESISDASCVAAASLKALYTRNRWLLPSEGVVAIVRPFPCASLIHLAGCGVDTVYSPERLENDSEPQEQEWIENWLRPNVNDSSKWYPRLFLEPSWKMKG